MKNNNNFVEIRPHIKMYIQTILWRHNPKLQMPHISILLLFLYRFLVVDDQEKSSLFLLFIFQVNSISKHLKLNLLFLQIHRVINQVMSARKLICNLKISEKIPNYVKHALSKPINNTWACLGREVHNRNLYPLEYNSCLHFYCYQHIHALYSFTDV